MEKNENLFRKRLGIMEIFQERNLRDISAIHSQIKLVQKFSENSENFCKKILSKKYMNF